MTTNRDESSPRHRRWPVALRTTLRASSLDGSFHAIMVGTGELYFPAFALLLGANVVDVGLLTTLPLLVGTIVQLAGPAAARRVGAKRFVVTFAALQSLSFLPLPFLPVDASWSFAALLLCSCAYWAFGLAIAPAWTAWMGAVIPESLRTRYFARRNSIVQASIFVALLAGGAIIQHAENSWGGAATGFSVVFVLAAAARLASARQLARQEDAPTQIQSPGILEWRGLLSSPPGRVMLLVGGMNGAVFIAAAYFTPYMLEALQLDYFEFTLLNASLVAARVAASPYWGRIGKRFGNRRALQVAATIIVPLPALWLLGDGFLYLLVLQVLAGFAWAGFDLMTVLNLFDCSAPAERSRVLAAFNLINGVAIVAGTLLGGIAFLALGDAAYGTVFLASSALRGLTSLAFSRGAGVRREDEHSFGEVLLRVMSLRPGLGPRLRPIAIRRAGSRRKRPRNRQPARPGRGPEPSK
jgi:MFS family permease